MYIDFDYTVGFTSQQKQSEFAYKQNSNLHHNVIKFNIGFPLNLQVNTVSNGQSISGLLIYSKLLSAR